MNENSPISYEEARFRTELRRVYRELHYAKCGDQGYYVPISECPHEVCVMARRFLALPTGPLDEGVLAKASERRKDV